MGASPTATLHLGDCLEVMMGMPDACVDSIVTDPPAGIAFMGKQFDTFKSRRAFIDFLTPRLAEALRLAKPGARALVWALPRTSHWTGTAVEDAGWVIEDRVSHIFGTGFPKAKSKLKPAMEDWWLARKPGPIEPLNIDECRIAHDDPIATTLRTAGKFSGNAYAKDHYSVNMDGGNLASASPAGRWPANLCLSHAEGCERAGTKRVKGSNGIRGASTRIYGGGEGFTGATGEAVGYADPDGTETVEAWQCVEGCPVKALDEMSGTLKSGGTPARRSGMGYDADRPRNRSGTEGEPTPGDSGAASRFFATFGYFPKASRQDRGRDNTHPTVKNTDLMEWLIRLITPPGGVVADPFTGSGSTPVACIRCGFAFFGCESDPEYHAIAERRMAAERADRPLFSGID